MLNNFEKISINQLVDSYSVIGIYCIKNDIKNQYYIGKSRNIGNRLFEHIIGSSNKNLQIDINNLGIGSFSFKILQSINNNSQIIKNLMVNQLLSNLEAEFIQKFKKSNVPLYNKKIPKIKGYNPRSNINETST